MLEPRENTVLKNMIYQVLVYRDVRGHFHGVYLRQSAQSLSPTTLPVLLYANHCSWWDAYMAMVVNERHWHRHGYVMVEDKQLSRYQFLRYLGAFSVSRTNPRAGAESLRFAQTLMRKDPNSMILMFPQGEILPNDLRPLGFYSGIGHLARLAAPCLAVPLALRYEYIGEQNPEAFLSVGSPVEVSTKDQDAKSITHLLERVLTDELDCLHTDIIGRSYSGFRLLVEGRWSLNRWWDAVRGKPPLAPLGPSVE